MRRRRYTDAIVVHCSATDNAKQLGADEIRRWHVRKGWRDIGYHFVVCRDGTVEVGRHVEDTGAHCKAGGYNGHSIGVCLVGGLDRRGRPDPGYEQVQLDMLGYLVIGLAQEFGVEDAGIFGHCDVEARKACPCFDVGRWWKTGEVR